MHRDAAKRRHPLKAYVHVDYLFWKAHPLKKSLSQLHEIQLKAVHAAKFLHDDFDF